MSTTKIFQSGNSQAVRIPKEFQFDVSEIEIFRQGEDVILRKKPVTGLDLFTQLASIDLPDDFCDSVDDLPTQERDF